MEGIAVPASSSPCWEGLGLRSFAAWLAGSVLAIKPTCYKRRITCCRRFYI